MIEKNRKTPPGKTPVRKSAAPAGAPKTPDAPKQAPRRTSISPEERYRMIAEAAYYRAQRRGFQGGDTARDWNEAEAAIDAMLLSRR